MVNLKVNMWRLAPDEADIWHDSKMSRAAQKSGQKRAQIVQFAQL